MNRKETTQILVILASNYKFFNEQMSEQGKSDIMVKTWQSCFEDIPYEIVSRAVKKMLLVSEYPPTISEVRKQAIEMVSPSKNKTAIEAWNEAYMMICRGGYMTEEEFEMASPEVKKFFGNVRQVKELARTEITTVNTVTKGQFLKQYEIIAERQKEQLLLPENMKEKLSKLQNNFIKQIGN